MKPASVLLLCGGPIHDWQAVGDVMESRLSYDGCDVTRIDDDLDVLAELTPGHYDSVALYWTRGEISDAQMTGLSRYVREGGGFVGVHGATASFRESPEFHALLGGLFIGHPPPRRYVVSLRNTNHPVTRGLPEEFEITDEQYTYDYDPRVNVLATALWKGIEHPVVWTKPWGPGRVAYHALGHDAGIAQQQMFGELLVRCVRWASTVAT